MAGAFKKTMIYLGLADGDDYDDERSGAEERAAAPRQSPAYSASSRSAEAGASSLRTGPVAAVPASGTPRGSEVVSIDAAAQGGAAAPGSHGAEAQGGADQGQVSSYNSSSLAVDPEYRAPVTPIKRAPSSRDESSAMRRITTVHPRSYNDAKVIGESFRDSIPVIMNVTDMGEAEAKRLVDFSAGLVFGLGGSIERVTNKVFLLTPKNVEVLAEERAAGDSPSSAQFFNQS